MNSNQDSITIGFIVKAERRKTKQIKRILKKVKDMEIVYITTSRNKLIITKWGGKA